MAPTQILNAYFSLAALSYKFAHVSAGWVLFLFLKCGSDYSMTSEDCYKIQKDNPAKHRVWYMVAITVLSNAEA